MPVLDTFTRPRHRWEIRILWEPRDCWVGVYWRVGWMWQTQWGPAEARAEGYRCLELYICLVPLLPLRLRIPWPRRT